MSHSTALVFISNPIQIGNRELAMSEFRSYLDSRGSIISQNEDLAAYFALPYIPDPSKHPSFQKLFHVSHIMVM